MTIVTYYIDSLFGARTSVTNATDRYANVDVGLLLYHMEHFRSVVILCTNLVKEIDPGLNLTLKRMNLCSLFQKNEICS